MLIATTMDATLVVSCPGAPSANKAGTTTAGTAATATSSTHPKNASLAPLKTVNPAVPASNVFSVCLATNSTPVDETAPPSNVFPASFSTVTSASVPRETYFSDSKCETCE